jgi:hypothetical protein
MVLEVYGCGYTDDIDKVKYNNRQNITHEEQAIEEIEGLTDFYRQLICRIQSLKASNFDGQELVRSHFEMLLEMIIDGFESMALLIK